VLGRTLWLAFAVLFVVFVVLIFVQLASGPPESKETSKEPTTQETTQEPTTQEAPKYQSKGY
jgi:hypothetical protein